MVRSYHNHIYALERKSILNSGHVANATVATSAVGAFAVIICAITHSFFLGLATLAVFPAAALSRAGTVSVRALLDHCRCSGIYLYLRFCL